MRMLLPKRPIRDAEAPTRELMEALEPERADAIQADRQASTKALGARQELLGSSLDELARLAGHLKHMEHMVGEIRGPLNDELLSHKHEHGELITIRAVLDQTTERLAETRERERALGAKVATLELALSESHLERQVQDSAIEDVRLEIDRLRTSLNESDVRGDGSAAALRDATLRMKQLEEDAAFLRKQAQEDDSFRREIDALLARASQEALLLEEEAATLRRRLEQATADAFRLSNLEMDLQAQLANERARMIPLQAATERAQAELLQLKGQAEEHVSAARSEITALNTRLETSAARANRLESLNADLSRRLSEAVSKHRTDERRTSEIQTSSERTLERASSLEEELTAQRTANASLERARLAALERADQLGKLLQSHEVTMRRAEERLRDMQLKLEASTGELEAGRRAQEQSSAGTSAEMERLRADLAIAEAGLKSAHEERERQHLASLNGVGLASERVGSRGMVI